jgi:hypothetical protein
MEMGNMLMIDLDTRRDPALCLAGNIVRIPIRNSPHRISIHQTFFDRLRSTRPRKERNADRTSSRA